MNLKHNLLWGGLAIVLFLAFRGRNQDYHRIAKEHMETYKTPRKDYVIVINYKRNILQDRLFLIEMRTGETVIKTKVSHAFFTGLLYPFRFSNRSGSKKSSIGCYITKGINQSPKFGYSMIIDGRDPGVNDNAIPREIIFHSDERMKTIYSDGCFATRDDLNRKIIDLTKNGCLVVVIG